MRFFKSTMLPHCHPILKSTVVHVFPGSTNWGHRNFRAIDWNDDHKAGALAGKRWHCEQDPCNMTSRQRYETLTCTSTKTIEITRVWEFFMMSDHSKHISCIKLWVHMRVPSAKQLRSPFQVSLHLGFWKPSFLFSNCHLLLWCYDPLHFIDKPLLKSK